ncbi:hypothetical protein A3I18_01715 [Candidatus Campbellbacteria bacterium RIFCSPLOWO2_02_FULL_35_11]|uniref:HTH arsR-type domain-containing protein n=2 Tax=Candidatus Campbelliibacteriota TaxID=1752727 RepID=A0A1F5EPK1_9BACT|nr:MAG: hypothetical protein A3E89_00230 [Candidatus Campbellbacteria bacterium RIFCSPHIGHO2_12_FULL_35_10]OGD69675.1 MAG: hypothetical protein A3I18_01715 [Candidatus Campbellbacteria bacterium RIFCSPLOWO2_02_FULL_35_11]
MKFVFTEKQMKLLEIFSKAIANKKRIKILVLIDERNDLSVEEISEIVKINYQTGATHIQRLEQVGFISKKYNGLRVNHRITKRGKEVLYFFQKILTLDSNPS